MSMNITQLKNLITAGLHGTTLNQIKNINGVIQAVSSQFILDHDWRETKTTAEIGNVFVNNLNYPCPPDLKGNRVIDIYPQVNRNYNSFNAENTRAFDRDSGLLNGKERMTIKDNNGVKTLRVQYVNGNRNPITVDNLSSIENFTTSGSMTSLSVDSTTVVPNFGSTTLKLDLDSGTGSIAQTLTNINGNPPLSNDYTRGAFFMWVYVEDPSKFTSSTIHIGTNNTNYVSITTSKTSSNTNIITGWNLLQYNFSASTITGTLTNAFTINYIKLDFAVTDTTSLNAYNLVFSVGDILMIEYYSSYMFRDAATGVWQETITNDSNLINLDLDAINCFVLLCQMYIARNQAGADSMFDYQFCQNLYQTSLEKYQRKYPSEIMTIYDNYYDTTLTWNRWSF